MSQFSLFIYFLLLFLDIKSIVVIIVFQLYSMVTWQLWSTFFLVFVYCVYFLFVCSIFLLISTAMIKFALCLLDKISLTSLNFTHIHANIHKHNITLIVFLNSFLVFQHLNQSTIFHANSHIFTPHYSHLTNADTPHT